MKLFETFKYELRYQSRGVSTWFYFLLLLVLSFLMAATVFVDEPLAGGYFLNAPYIIAKVSLITFFFLGLLVLAQFAGNAAARDLETRMHPLFYSAPISKDVYLGGRFLAAFVLGAIVMMAIPIGIFAAGLFPLEHAELIGPMNGMAYLSTYLLLLLPNTFFVVAFMFAVAVLSKKGMLSYLIAVFIGVMVITSWQVLGSQQDNWTIANLTDPLGLTFIQEAKELWTANQKNTLLPAMEISTLINRSLWFTLSASMLLITYFSFKTSTLSRKEKKSEKKRNAEVLASEHYQVVETENVTTPPVTKSFDLSTRLLQIWTITKESFRLIALGWGWIALVCMFLFVVLTGSMWFSDYYDIPELPVTGNLLGTLQNVKDHGIWFIIPLLIIYYAGELVWRERDVRLNDIIGAAPVPVWVSLSGKFAGMFLALIGMQLFLMIAGMLLQVTLGYYDFQIHIYLKILFGLRLIDYALLAILAIALHVILNQKYVAHLITVLFYLLPIFGPEFGIESGLFLYGSDPGWSYSDLRGLSPFMEPWIFFKMYWGAWAMLLAVVTTLLWPRGTEKNFSKRFQQGIGNSNIVMKLWAAISVLLVLVSGGFIFYSTHLRFPETAFVETLEWKAEYEKRYEKYSKSPQPSATNIKLLGEIYPEKGSADFKGTYRLVNTTASRIDTLFISTSPGIQHHELRWSEPVRSEVIDEELDFNIYVLEKTLLPGDSIQLTFHVNYDPKGFPNHGMKTLVAQNGTYFEDAWLPVIGYQGGRQIYDANDRKTQGLEPKTFLERENESYAQQRVRFETIIGTDQGQIAVAPGKLLRRWIHNNRNYFHYTTEKPVNHKSAFFSSDYEVYKAQWKSDSAREVDIRVLHHPGHTHNLERMVKGVQASFDYLTREFGKYPHSEIKFTEVPGYNKGLHAYPMNIFYREGFALLKPEEDPREIDIVFATVAHEVAHQWWGHQVSPAPIKGAALITESLAWHSAFEIVEESLGRETFLNLLELARDDYFSPQERSADPLLQANQTSLIYRKGPLALYALREYIGKEKLQSALHTFFDKYSALNSTRPVPSDLYKELHDATPDSLSYLLHDLFASNTFWELKTENVSVSKTASGQWKVTLDMFARKYTVDQMGNETNIEMNDWIQIGVYGEGKKDPEALYLQQHRFQSGKQTIEIEVSQKPSAAGIDPNALLMDVRPWNNVISVEMVN